MVVVGMVILCITGVCFLRLKPSPFAPTSLLPSLCRVVRAPHNFVPAVLHAHSHAHLFFGACMRVGREMAPARVVAALPFRPPRCFLTAHISFGASCSTAA